MENITIVPVEASERGALEGLEVSCSCGLTFRTSLPSLAQSEAAEHAAWHARQLEGRRSA